MKLPAGVRPLLGRPAEVVARALARVGGGPPPGLRRGDGAPPADVPVVVVHLRAGAEERPDEVLGPVTEARRAGEAFTPVLLLERPPLAPFRRAGYVVELVTDRGLAPSLAEVFLTYSAAGVVPVGPEDLDDPTALRRRLLAAVPAPRTGAVAAVRRAAAALERRLP